mgnify:CR=1 FL=1
MMLMLFLLKRKGKKVIYSGDFREHGRKRNAFNYFIKAVPKNVDVLMLEETMFGRQSEKVKTEQEIENEVNQLVKENRGITLMNIYKHL